ncbi:MAG TPA: LytR C-terminal domain-containing protein [Longimicrobiales bacterium]|nr:LytR C-terminal domain-containing protein [Longimicrobiales bacterium]
MRERAESIALAAAALLLIALLVSGVAGLLQTTTSRPGLAARAPAPERTSFALPATPRGRVEVLNAAGRAGLARRATEQLRRAGYDVVYFGNAPERRDSSLVLDRVGRPDIARGAGERLGIARTRTERDTTLLLDATILLGADWAVAVARAERPDESGWRARVRRWLGGR